MTNTSVATTSKTSADMLANLQAYTKLNNIAMHSFLSFNGKLAVFKMRDSDGTEADVKLGTKVAVNLQAITRGFVCWKEKKQIGSTMASIWDLDAAVKKEDLPDLGPFVVNDKVREGWTEQMTVPCKDMETGVEYLFQVSSRSALSQMDHFIRKVMLAAAQHDIASESPVVELDRSFFTNKQTGDKVYYPVLKITGWTPTAPVGFTPPRARPVAGQDETVAKPSSIKAAVEDAEVVD